MPGISQKADAAPCQGSNYPTCEIHSPSKKRYVILVEETIRFGVADKYVTQSTWPHAVLYIGHTVDPVEIGEDARVIVEADIRE